MKTARAFLLIVTVSTCLFVESSTAAAEPKPPAPTEENRAENIEAAKEFVARAFDSSNAALAVATKTVNEALAKAKADGERKALTIVSYWLKSLVGFSAAIENAILVRLARGTNKAVKEAIVVLSNAMNEVREDLAKYIEVLEASPGKGTDRIIAVLNKEFGVIFSDGDDNLEVLRSLLPGKGPKGQ